MTQSSFTETSSQSWYNNVSVWIIGASILFLVVWIILAVNSANNKPIQFTQLKPNSQAAITSFLQLQNINCTLNGQPMIFTMGHYLLNDAQCGILLQNAAGNKIYITYYEFLNWIITTQGILYVPSRVLREDVPSTNVNNMAGTRIKDYIDSFGGDGYSLYYNSSNNTYMILSSLNTPSSSFIKYTDTNNIEQTVTTDKEPDIIRHQTSGTGGTTN
jgi:hypothetical protein